MQNVLIYSTRGHSKVIYIDDVTSVDVSLLCLVMVSTSGDKDKEGERKQLRFKKEWVQKRKI